MRKLFGKKVNLDQPTIVFPISVFLIVLICTFLLIPKVASTVFPAKRQLTLNEFLKNTQEKNTINAQSYWKFREFYSPGYFNFDKNGLSIKEDDYNGISLTEQLSLNNLVFLEFTSPYLTSLDILTTENELGKIINTNPSDGKIIFQAKNQIIIENEETIKIMFLKSEDEMKTANGFFDYGGEDKELVKNKIWLNVTRLIKP